VALGSSVNAPLSKPLMTSLPKLRSTTRPYQIRETRLQAKELVLQAIATGNAAQAQDIAAETIASIEAAVAGIGNNLNPH